MENDIKEILNTSIFAPSGDNSQPWRFKIKNNTVSVYNVPESDSSLYNFNMSASMIAIGALLENIRISATHFGYNAEIIINNNLPDNLIALCVFTKELIDEDILYSYIKKRQTNRKPYKNSPINEDFIKEIEKYNFLNGLSFKIMNDTKSINEIANASSVNEQIVLENKKLHDFLFDHITWSNKEDEEKRGFYIKTLELKGPQFAFFKLLRNWKINKLLNKIGISKFVAKDNAKIYAQSDAMLAIISDNLSQRSFIETGILMQKLWLIATKYDLYMQPLTGIVFLYHRVNSKINKEIFNPEHIRLINSSYSSMKKVIDIDNKSLTILLRLGYADSPTAGTRRRVAEIKLE